MDDSLFSLNTHEQSTTGTKTLGNKQRKILNQSRVYREWITGKIQRNR